MSAADREKWNARHRERGFFPTEPSTLVQEQAEFLATSGTALDVAGGSGRHALWLCERGLSTTLIDVSEEACRIAKEEAVRRHVELETVAWDVMELGLPSGTWDVILCFHFHCLALLPAAAKQLRPGGHLLYVQPTTTNLERHARPPRSFLFEPGQLRSAAEQAGLRIVHWDEGWLAEERHESLLVASTPER